MPEAYLSYHAAEAGDHGLDGGGEVMIVRESGQEVKSRGVEGSTD
jgi:hypothetical protein